MHVIHSEKILLTQPLAVSHSEDRTGHKVSASPPLKENYGCCLSDFYCPKCWEDTLIFSPPFLLFDYYSGNYFLRMSFSFPLLLYLQSWTRGVRVCWMFVGFESF